MVAVSVVSDHSPAAPFALHPLASVSCGTLLNVSSPLIEKDRLWDRSARADCIHSVVECGLDIGRVEQGHGDVVKRSSGGRPALLQPNPQLFRQVTAAIRATRCCVSNCRPFIRRKSTLWGRLSFTRILSISGVPDGDLLTHGGAGLALRPPHDVDMRIG
jgi:hypothetical protein